jgi:hypothetical protein
MKHETIKKLEAICNESRHGFLHVRLADSMYDDTSYNIVRSVCEIMFTKRDQDLAQLRDNLLNVVAEYFGLEEEPADEVIDTSEPAYGNFNSEKESKLS